jgi:hypothetical protein
MVLMLLVRCMKQIITELLSGRGEEYSNTMKPRRANVFGSFFKKNKLAFCNEEY